MLRYTKHTMIIHGKSPKSYAKSLNKCQIPGSCCFIGTYPGHVAVRPRNWRRRHPGHRRCHDTHVGVNRLGSVGGLVFFATVTRVFPTVGTFHTVTGDFGDGVLLHRASITSQRFWGGWKQPVVQQVSFCFDCLMWWNDMIWSLESKRQM